MEVQKRVRELMQEQARAKGTGTDIVLADIYTREKAANREYQQVAFPRTKRGTGGKGVRRGEAYVEGAQYGSTINLNRQVQ